MKLVRLTNTSATLADKAYQSIRDAVVTLNFKPGQYIYENEIANSLGVSRTPVREAFRQLMLGGMVEILPQKGIKVAAISKKKVEEVRFVRESLEISAFREAAGKWDSNDRKCRNLQAIMVQTMREQKDNIAKNDYISFLKCDEKFHYLILDFINNKTLVDVISQMRDHLNRVRYLELLESKHMAAVVNQHENIFRAITENDEDKVEQLLKEHFRKFQFDDKLINKYEEYFIP